MADAHGFTLAAWPFTVAEGDAKAGQTVFRTMQRYRRHAINIPGGGKRPLYECKGTYNRLLTVQRLIDLVALLTQLLGSNAT